MCAASDEYRGVTRVKNVVVQLDESTLAVRHAKQREDILVLARTTEKSIRIFLTGKCTS